MGVYLSQPETSKNIHKGENQKIAFCCAEMQGWRKNMEDAAIHQLDLGDGNALFAVFDGHGGPQVSYLVKQQFTNHLKNNKSYIQKDYSKALHETFKEVDQMIRGEKGIYQLKKIRKEINGVDNVINDTIGNGTGCTANVILITKEKIIVANAGDSRSVLCRNGNALDLSNDHKPQNQQQEQRIVKAGGCITMGRVNGGLNLTRSFGDFDYKQNKALEYHQQAITCCPDIKQFDRGHTDDFILAGCDGIWERYVQNSQGLIDIVKEEIKKQSLEKIMQELLDYLLAKDTKEGIGCDNMTAILIRFK